VNPAIKGAIERGRLVLLLGAGASADCKDRHGRLLPDADALAAELASQAGFTHGSEPLPIVYAAAREQLGDKIWPILEDRFRFCQPSAAIRTIADFPWARVYTLNIDDSFERAAQHTKTQHLAVRHRKDKIAQLDPFFERLDLVKLNGSADRLEAGLIFSPQEYGEGSATPPPWYEELAEDYFRYLFLFIGTRLNEPLFHHQVERYRRVAKATAGVGYVLTRTATDIEKKSLESLHLIHHAGTIDDFAAWLRTEDRISAKTDCVGSRRGNVPAAREVVGTA
jgi:hypothetical protein